MYRLIWIHFNSFSRYRPFPKQEVNHLSPIIALNSRFRLEKVNSYGQGKVYAKK